MNIICSFCNHVLKSPGGLIFSPPSYNTNEKQVFKYHLCRGCYQAFIRPILTAIREREEKENSFSIW